MFEIISEESAEKEIKKFLKETEPIINDIFQKLELNEENRKTAEVIMQSFATLCYATGRTEGMKRAKEIVEHLVSNVFGKEVFEKEEDANPLD